MTQNAPAAVRRSEPEPCYSLSESSLSCHAFSLLLYSMRSFLDLIFGYWIWIGFSPAVLEAVSFSEVLSLQRLLLSLRWSLSPANTGRSQMVQ